MQDLAHFDRLAVQIRRLAQDRAGHLLVVGLEQLATLVERAAPLFGPAVRDQIAAARGGVEASIANGDWSRVRDTGRTEDVVPNRLFLEPHPRLAKLLDEVRAAIASAAPARAGVNDQTAYGQSYYE